MFSMHDLNGPWLNFEEVTQKTGMVKNEILYAIQEKRITPVIYTNSRHFLAISECSTGQRVGHADIRYSGPIAIHPQGIQEIVADGKTILGLEPVTLLSPTGVLERSTKYPYITPAPNQFLTEWQPNTDIANDTVTILFKPYEYSDYEDAESGVVAYIPEHSCEDKYLDDNMERFFIRSPNDDYVYGAYYSHVYGQDDLRFPLAAIDCLMNPKKVYSVKKPSRIRRNELHNVISRAIEKNPSAQSGTLWNTLRKDIQKIERDFDCDHVIHSIDQISIHWVSANGVQQTLKKSSFKIIVSRLRKIGLAA